VVTFLIYHGKIKVGIDFLRGVKMMKHVLSLNQSLQWKLNQSLMQSINMLQLTSGELIDYLKHVAEENPLIEEVKIDFEWEQFIPTNTSSLSIGEINQPELSMYDQLKNQLYTLSITDELKKVIEFGIDSLNEDGYLEIEMEEWARICNTTIEMVERALTNIQSLEPAGVGARTFQECMLLQLKQLNQNEPYMEHLLMENLELIADHNLELISEIYQISLEQANQLIENIKLCHPKPGQLLAKTKPEYIIPEASIYKECGEWKISFYKWTMPKLVLNPAYNHLAKSDKEAVAYLKEKHKEIDSLKQAIQYRGNTLERVIRNILEKQLSFFEYGPYKIQPLTLREIAADLNLHISTVSRAISQKYIQTNQGVLPLKFFLQRGIGNENGNSTASYVIKQLILEYITHEDKRNPLSDEAIRQKLMSEFNIKVARRTIMKYRDQLNIASSIKRRQEG